jgi:hypothetical protein
VKYSLFEGATSHKRGTVRLIKRDSCQNLVDYLAVHVSQPVVTALEFKRQLGVVDSQTVENGRVQIVHVDRIAGDVVAVVVRFPVGNPRLDACAGEPNGEATRVVIAAVIVRS